MLPSAATTAQHYFKRFYIYNSVMDYHPKEILWVAWNFTVKRNLLPALLLYEKVKTRKICPGKCVFCHVFPTLPLLCSQGDVCVSGMQDWGVLRDHQWLCPQRSWGPEEGNGDHSEQWAAADTGAAVQLDHPSAIPSCWGSSHWY